MDHPAETAIPIPTIPATRNTTAVRARVPERRHHSCARALVKLCNVLLAETVIIALLFSLFLLCGFIMRLSVQTEMGVEPESSITFSNMTIASHVVISVKNHNKHLSVKYTVLHVGVAYRGHYLCTTSTQSFSQGRRNGTTVSTTAALPCTTTSSDEFDSWRVHDDHLEADSARGEVDIEVILLAAVEFGPWWFFQHVSSLRSYVKFTNSSNGGGQSMIMHATAYQ